MLMVSERQRLPRTQLLYLCQREVRGEAPRDVAPVWQHLDTEASIISAQHQMDSSADS